MSRITCHPCSVGGSIVCYSNCGTYCEKWTLFSEPLLDKVLPSSSGTNFVSPSTLSNLRTVKAAVHEVGGADGPYVLVAPVTAHSRFTMAIEESLIPPMHAYPSAFFEGGTLYVGAAEQQTYRIPVPSKKFLLEQLHGQLRSAESLRDRSLEELRNDPSLARDALSHATSRIEKLNDHISNVDNCTNISNGFQRTPYSYILVPNDDGDDVPTLCDLDPVIEGQFAGSPIGIFMDISARPIRALTARLYSVMVARDDNKADDILYIESDEDEARVAIDKGWSDEAKISLRIEYLRTFPSLDCLGPSS